MLPLGTCLVALCFYVYAPCFYGSAFESAEVGGYSCCFFFNRLNFSLLFLTTLAV